MAIKLTNRNTTLEKATSDASSAARAGERSSVLNAGVDTTRAAVQSAHGSSNTEQLSRGEGRVTARRRVSTSEMAQSVDASALEVKAILGRMRQLAVRASTLPMSDQDRTILQDEFAMLGAEIDRVAMLAEGAQRSRADSKTVQLPVFSEDNGREDVPFIDDFIARLTSKNLGLSPDKVGVDSPREAEWALFRIDAAADEVLKIRDEFGTVEERMDVALDTLSEFVQKHFPDAERHGPPSEVIRAAERVRLELMHQDAVSEIGQADGLQQSVNALLQ